MPHITRQHRANNPKPDAFLLRQTQHNPLINSKEQVEGADIGEQEAEQGRHGDGDIGGIGGIWGRGDGGGEVGGEGHGAGEEAVGIEEAEVGAAESSNGLEIEEPDAVDEGDAGDEGGLG